jgi:hypothetical protein
MPKINLNALAMGDYPDGNYEATAPATKYKNAEWKERNDNKISKTIREADINASRKAKEIVLHTHEEVDD